MKCLSEMLQNMPYFIHKKTQSCFFRFSFYGILFFSPNECRHRPGHSLGKKVRLHEMKNGKSNYGFSYINIIYNMANFEAFCWVISSSIILLFLKSVVSNNFLS